MRKHIQFLSLFLQTFFKKQKKYLLISSIIGFFSTLILIQIYPFYVEFYNNKNKIIGIIGQYNESSLPLLFKNKISLGLTALTDKGEVEPSLAKSWQIRDNGKTYIIKIKENYFWHNNKPFTAEDVIYPIKGAIFTPIDATTLKISLEDKYVPLPVLLSQPLLKPNLVGLGNYKVKKIIKNGEIITQLLLIPQAEKLPSINYKFYTNINEAFLAFKLGEVDKLENIPEAGEFHKWKSLKISETTLYDRYVGIFFNLSNPLFKDKEIRQALAYGVPKLNDYEKAHSPISPKSWAYSNKIRQYSYDPETAKKILSKSQLATSSVELHLSTFPNTLTTAQIITDQWNKTGINVKIRVENNFSADYEMFLLTQLIPPDPDQYYYWQSMQDQTNITHYSNPKIDRLLEQGRITDDIEERKKIYYDFQRYLVDDAPVIFLYYPKAYSIERK